MSHRFPQIFALYAFLALSPLAAFAGDADSAPALEEMNGQDLYKSICKPCHLPDAEGGEYTPMSLIQEQWEEFFADIYVDTHNDVTSPLHDDQTVTDLIDAEMLEKIRVFCVDHAADSEQPMTCG